MRIQHNIMAMNAYRNYNNNTSSLSSNLEKLSSGYKINRAGDDAAGLAISEKMRAQISGLDQAASNVKDGISLVKTGEGAMQEIQDMLNRMVTLATQSANGTYDEETDRDNLQKEVDALKSEINRIADSANFNGIKLLDGSMTDGQDNTVSGNMTVGDLLPEVGTTVGTDTVLHVEDPTDNTGSKFTVDLNNLKWTPASTGDTLTLTIGDKKITVTATAGGASGAMTASAIVSMAMASLSAGASITINGKTFTIASSSSACTQANQIYVTNTAGTITFAQAIRPTKEDDVLSAPATVKVETSAGDYGTQTAAGQDYAPAVTNITNVTLENTPRLANTSFKLTADMAGAGATMKLGNQTFTFTDDKTKKDSTAQQEGYVYVGDLDLTTEKGLTQAASRLTQTANASASKAEATGGNGSGAIFTVGYDGTNITLTEKDNAIDYSETTNPSATRKYDLSTEEGLSKALSYKGVAKTGKSLTLQIGDTSDDYNQLNVSISDMHVTALGINDIDISTQDSAQEAINYIKEAINKVSSTRGDLGAVQNRLEHTSNNLSVMSENIQDAESTIRDTDIAEEMMSYTKNNILVQSAQAMLAQANSVPQGVLQLLQ